MAFTPEPHNSGCPSFCPDLSRAEPPGVGRVEPVNLPCRGCFAGHVHRKVGMAPPQSHTIQSLTPPESVWTSTPWPRRLTPQQGWITGSPENEATASPRLMLHGGECPTQERWHLWCGGGLSPGILVAAPSPPSTEPQTSISPQETLLHSTRVQGKWLQIKFCALAL